MIRPASRWAAGPVRATLSSTTTTIATTAASRSMVTVPLSHTVHAPPTGEPATGDPVLILHGLFGSKANWRTMAQNQLPAHLTTPRNVIPVDLRNHGTSPHTPHMDYASMAADVTQLAASLPANHATLMGHSLGGRVAMVAAITHPDLFRRLIVVDVAPCAMPPSTSFVRYLEIMQEIDAARVHSRRDAHRLMESAVPDINLRHFLLTNLVPDPNEAGVMKFRVNLPTIAQFMPTMWKFTLPQQDGTPAPAHAAVYDRPALFVRGTRSGYIQDAHLDKIKAWFPRSEVVDMDAGHWPHAERPNEFANVVGEWISRTDGEGAS
ncbi:hypothetical protein GGF32_007767 [Allomyces javanicus]|nr:hypothetical protein GGF32_007767 [Allomyces javanicus]